MRKFLCILSLFFINASIVLLLPSCSTAEDVDINDDSHSIGIVVPDLVNEDGDPILKSRSSLTYVSKKMKFAWESNDEVGVFNVSESQTNNIPFYFKGVYDNDPTTARFQNGQFSFDEEKYWVAYSPYLCDNTEGDIRKKVTDYSNIRLTYRGQRQLQNARIYKADGSSQSNEAAASAHLGNYDYLISDPVKPVEDTRMTFHCKHVGGTVRFYMLFPEGAFGGNGKKGYVKDISVIYSGTQHPTPFVSDVTIGINQYSEGGESYREIATTKTNKMTLACGEKGSRGIEVPDYEYFITYMEFYPTWVEENSCYLFLTVDVDGVEHYFKSKPLAAKVINAGGLVQWTTADFKDVIELVTATLVPWEDLNGGEINTGE